MKKEKNLNLSSLKNINVLTGSAFLIAACVIIDFFRIVVSPTFEISFSFLALAVTGILYGPFIGGVVGGIADIIQYIVRPSGFFFPGFTLNSILSGVIFGLFFYNKKLSIKRIALAVLVEGLIINLMLTPIWLNMMYGSALFALPRLIRFFILFPIKVSLIYAFWKIIENQNIKNKIKIK